MADHELLLSNGVRVTIPDIDSVVFQTGENEWVRWTPEFLRDLLSTVMLPGNDSFRLIHWYCEYRHAHGVLTVIDQNEATFLTLTDQELSQIAAMYRAVKAAYIIWRHEQKQQQQQQQERRTDREDAQ